MNKKQSKIANRIRRLQRKLNVLSGAEERAARNGEGKILSEIRLAKDHYNQALEGYRV